MPIPYTDKVINNFLKPHNAGSIQHADAVATEGSPACGDQVKLYLKVNPETKKIDDVKFESYGCASNIATASIITDIAKGKTIEEAKKLTWKTADQELGGLPPVKIHCAVLAVDTLHAAIENYEQSHGLIKDPKKTTKDIVLSRLKHVINPLTGFNIVRANIIGDVKVDNGTVTVLTKLAGDHQFAGNIKEEIIERIEPLWDVKNVEVKFAT